MKKAIIIIIFALILPVVSGENWIYQENADSYSAEQYSPYIYVDYYKPGGVLEGSLWQVRHGNSTTPTYNVSIPLDCWQQDPLNFRLYSHSIPGESKSYGECYNSNSWKMLTEKHLINNDNWPGTAGYTQYVKSYDGNWQSGGFYGNEQGWFISTKEPKEATWWEEGMWWEIGGDLCENIVCDNKCDGTTKYSGGSCSDGQCSYSTVEENSVDCGYDPCEGVICDDYCDRDMRYYNGICSNSVCTYSTEACSYSCSSGKCVSESGPKITKVEYEYDDYGNIIKISYLGDISKTGDEKYGYYEYYYNTDKWIVNRPKKSYLLNSDDSTKLRESYYSYNDYGDLTKEEQWLDSGSNSIINYDYNSYGNLISIKDPNEHTTKYEYDSTHTFIIKVTNAKNQESTYEYDLGTGNILSEIDPNGYKKEYKYDVFGRTAKEIIPYDSETSPTVENIYNFDGTAPEKTIIKYKEDSTGTLDDYYFYGGFGNLIQLKKESEGSEYITNDQYYDELSRLKQESNPYYSSSLEYTIPDTEVKKSEFSYDVLDRQIKTKNPDNTEIKIEYNNWTTSVYDENNHRKDYIEDAYGNIIEVKEYNNNEVYSTTYEYNAAGDLVKITDDNGNEIKYTYDTLGRKTKLEDPDLGTWTYYYDASENLIKQKDNKGNEISLSYDELDRIKTKTTSEGTITYTYDQGAIGILSSIQTSHITKNFEYDKRLRVTNEERIIDGIKFKTAFLYDSMDRVLSKTLPNGEVIEFTYNNQGNKESISGIMSNINYNEADKPVKKEYENSLATDFSYNQDDYRLTRIKTGSKQDLNYQYDNKDNIIEIDDKKNDEIETFTYDDLDRLKTAVKINNEGEKEYDTSYGYNSIGNILNLFSNIYNIDFSYSNKAHAPSSMKIEFEGVCSSDSQCGTDGWVGSDYCSGDDVWNTYRTYTCTNPDTPSALCSHSDAAKLKEDCAETCQNGACAGIECSSDSQCGTDGWVGSDYCSGDDVWNTYRTYTCTNPDTPSALCSHSDAAKLKEDCNDGLYCNGQESCQDAACVEGTAVDCSENNLAGIATCTNDPDKNSFTWDYFAGFTSTCNEATDSCTTGTVSLTHTCSVDDCDAECAADADCDANSCSETYNDYCTDTKLTEYDNDKKMDSTTVDDSCDNNCLDDCTCTDCDVNCEAPSTNTYCVKDVCDAECAADADCDANSCSETYDDYCDGKKLVEYDSDKIKDSTTVEDSCTNNCKDDCSCEDCGVDCSAPSTNSYCVKDVCNAECAADADCSCAGADGCIDSDGDGLIDDYADYPAGSCQNGCTCGSCEATISKGDARCKTTMNVVIDKGVSMFSLPLEPVSGVTFNDIQSGCSFTPGYTNGISYMNPSTGGYTYINGNAVLYPGQGYFTTQQNRCELTIEGYRFTMDYAGYLGSHNIKTGWNMIGAPSEQVDDFDTVEGNCNVVSRPLGFDSATYKDVRTQTLVPGKGYWIKTTNSCKLG